MAKKKALPSKSKGNLVGPKLAGKLKAENEWYESLAPAWSETQTLEQELVTESGIKAIRRKQARQNRRIDKRAEIQRRADELGISKKDLPKYRKQIKWAMEQESKPIAKASGLTKAEKEWNELNSRAGNTYKPEGTFVATRNPDGFSHTSHRLEDEAPTGIKIVRALTGDKPGATTPTLSEVANVVATLGTAGAAKALRAPAIAKAATAAREADEAAAAANAVRKASNAARAKRAAAAGGSTRAASAGRAARNAGKRAGSRTRQRYKGPARKARRKNRTANLVSRGTNPAIAPLPITDTGKALIEGHVNANFGESAETTGRALPGIFTFPVSAATAAGESIATQDIGPVKGLAETTVQGLGDVAENLLSGDPELVEQTVEQDVGYSFVPLIPRTAATRPVQAAKTASRAGVRTFKDATNPTFKGRPVFGEGENVFDFTARRETREAAAQDFRRSIRPHENEAKYHARQVTRHLPKLKKYEDEEMGMGAGDVVAVVAEYGIPRNTTHQARAIQLAKGRIPDESGAPVGTITDSRVFEFLDKHPDLLKEARFWKMVDAYKASSEYVAYSERARWMTLGDVGGFLRPEQRTPMAVREFTDAPDRAGAWKDLKAMEKEIALLKGDIRAAAKNGDREEAVLLRSQVKELQAKRDAFSKILRRYTKPDVKASSRVRTTLYDRDLVQEYVDEVQAWAKAEGFEDPAWTSQVTARYEDAEMGGPRFPAAGVRVQHVRSGGGLEGDLLDRSLRALVSGSIFQPRLRRGSHEAVVRFFDRERIPINVNGKEQYLVTQAEFGRAIAEGQLPSRAGIMGRQGYVWVPSRTFQSGVKDLRTGGEDLASAARKMQDEMAVRDLDPKTKGYIVSREAAKEFADQIDPIASLPEKVLNAFAKGSSRTLLLLSPGWAIAQIIAEALPMLATMNNPARIARAARALRKMGDVSPDEARAFASMAGESPVTLHQPHDLRIDLKPGMAEEAAHYHKVMSRNKVYRALVSTGKLEPLGLFDRWRTGKYRKLLLAYNVDKNLNGWIGGMRGMLKESNLLAEKLKGKPLHEQMAILAKDQKAAERVVNYLEDMAGNWDTFTRFERQFAPALIFYGFLRYSMRFLWNFPKHHPVRGTMLYLLSQMNAEQVENLLGTTPASWRDYANPVLYDEEGADGVLPIGTRIMPGLNAITEAIGSGHPVGLLRALNPGLGIPAAAGFGVDPFSGEKEAEGWGPQTIMFLNQLLAMPAPLRAINEYTGVDTQINQEESSAGQAFDDIDPLSTFRSVVFPPLPLSAGQAKAKNDLSKALEESSNKPAFGDYIKAYLAGDWAAVAELEEQIQVSEAAQDALDTLLPSSATEDAEVSEASARYFGITRGANTPTTESSGPSWATASPSSTPAPAAPDTDRPSWAGGEPLTPPGLDPIEGQADRPSWATAP